MSSIWLGCCVVILTVLSQTQAKEPNLAGDEYVFELNDSDGSVCFYASFQLDYKISYLQYPNISNKSIKHVMSTEIKLPNNTQVLISGDCGVNETKLLLSWENGEQRYNSSFLFTLTNSTWYANFISFSFDLAKLPQNPVDMGVQTYVTNITNLFSRDFTRKDFFYCEKCKTFAFANCSEDTLGCVDPCSKNEKNKTECNNTLEMMHAVIYPGDIQEQSANRKLCIEDYIALQELIVPIVVGGILAILLVLIFVAYIIAYIRRRRREGKYERLSETTY
ncbi:uncharacterized protein LOC135342053 [Halichondria panicea]|uniref:uncharacterized protein LOC135342053 n=1 Tax=Halichondria panicea TaxID=6063 RepID=UPI00312BAA6A